MADPWKITTGSNHWWFLVFSYSGRLLFCLQRVIQLQSFVVQMAESAFLWTLSVIWKMTAETEAMNGIVVSVKPYQQTPVQTADFLKCFCCWSRRQISLCPSSISLCSKWEVYGLEIQMWQEPRLCRWIRRGRVQHYRYVPLQTSRKMTTRLSLSHASALSEALQVLAYPGFCRMKSVEALILQPPGRDVVGRCRELCRR